MGNRSQSMRGALAGIALLLAALGIALGSVEAVLRWLPMLLPRPVRAINNRMETAVQWDQTVVGDPYLGFKPLPNIARTVTLDGVTAEIRTAPLVAADVGFRDMGAKFSGPPTDIAVGDSFTVCYGVPSAECWVGLLAQRSGHSIANLGVSGYSAVAAARLLERYGAAFQPRVVLHGLFLNDFEENLDFERWARSGKDNLRAWYHEQNLGELGYQLYRRFRTYRVVRAMLRAGRSQTFRLQDDGLNLYMRPTGWWRRATERAVQPKSFDVMKRVLLQEQQAAQAMGARLIVLLFPFKEQVYWDRMVARESALRDVDVDAPFRLLADLCQEHGIASVDLTEVLREHARAGEQLYFSIDAHWNPRGNAVVAESLFNTLRAQGVL
jgi:hypothetical protein